MQARVLPPAYRHGGHLRRVDVYQPVLGTVWARTDAYCNQSIRGGAAEAVRAPSPSEGLTAHYTGYIDGHKGRTYTTNMITDEQLMEPVGSIEIAARIGVKPDTIVQWRRRPQLAFPEPRWTVSGRPAWAWRDISEWSIRSGRMVTVVNSEEEAVRRVGGVWEIPGQGSVAILGYRPTGSGTFVLTSVPQAALVVRAHPMDGAWKLSCGRWLMPDQLPQVERHPGAHVSAPSCDHRDTLEAEWPAPL